MANIAKKPVLADSLYKFRSIPEVVEDYARKLASYYQHNPDEMACQIQADILLKYADVHKNDMYYEDIPALFNGLYDELKDIDPNILFKFEGRRKSLISLVEKLIYCEQHDLTSLISAGKDLLGFRIIIFTSNNDNQKNIDLCYKTLEKAIQFFCREHFFLTQATPLKDVGNFSQKKYPHIYVPAKSSLNPQLVLGVKDYIATPKINGYQGLHAVFESEISTSNESFELQIRTINMHYHSTQGNATVRKDKQCRKELLDVDFTKVNIPGFYYSNSSNYIDFIGLIDGLSILGRNKTNKFL